ncbi:GILT-like protein 2 [Pararge aegeria]|uniref:GILT-like protein 2 n=1 Tax=Pararge aegeria TaxID=116150 RepID=UPI0019D07879|nr:GILT-like protein 2 [Pararge aegeria]
MFDLKHFVIFVLFSVFRNVYTQSQNEVREPNDLSENGIPEKCSDWDTYWINNQINANNVDEVDVKLYYESLCPDCIQFDKEQFNDAVQKLSQYVDFHTYPYGNAKTINENGVIEFECQHGPPECYGNKLHACAIDNLNNITESVAYNSCMMGGENRGSDDAAADRCAASLGIDSTPIKACAKGDRGTELLEYYGEESKKANFSYVPYILINGKENDGSNFMRDICAAFAVSPPPCVEYSVLLLDQML